MRKKVVPSVVIVAAVIGVLAWQWATQWRYIESTDDAYVDGDITGIAPKVSGYVVEVAAGDNRTVAKGDVLVRVDDRDYRAKAEEARAVVAARTAQWAQLDDRVAVQQAMAQQASATISAAQADVKRARQDLERTGRLVREDYVSRQRFDLNTADAAKAEAGLRGSGAQLAAARHQLAVLAHERAIALAQLEQAKAQLALAETDLDATVLRTPIDGVIGNRGVRVGQYVRPGQHLLAVVPLAGVWVDANFKETQLGRLRPGQPAEIAVDAYSGVVLTGRIDSFAPASGSKFSLLPAENATGNFTKVVQRVPVRIVVAPDNPLAGRLRPGLSVVVKVDTRGE
jgi:membrane fusion protein (multidrug efflux system)